MNGTTDGSILRQWKCHLCDYERYLPIGYRLHVTDPHLPGGRHFHLISPGKNVE